MARLVDIRVLEEDYTSEWAFPTFAITKNNGTIRVVSDFSFRKAISIPYLMSPIFITKDLGHDLVHGKFLPLVQHWI
jgi:hypothetical protein